MVVVLGFQGRSEVPEFLKTEPSIHSWALQFCISEKPFSSHEGRF